MRGVLNINKPGGITSYDVVRRVKRLLTEAGSRDPRPGPRRSPTRLGHAGTLDPLASGVLLLLVGDATKASRFLMDQPKEYEADIRLGARTDTDDVTGRVVAEAPVPELSAETVSAVLARFTGTLEQVPPAYSALKKDGQPLYRLARAGVAVEPEARSVTVYELELLGLWPPHFRVRARVSAGTYIRSLARDIGRALGTEATLAALERTRVGRFAVGDALSLDRLDLPGLEAGLVPVEQALGLPVVTVTGEEAVRLQQGQVVLAGERAASGSYLLARTEDGRFLAAVRSGDELRVERVIYAS